MKLIETPDVGTSTSTQSIVLEAAYGISFEQCPPNHEQTE